MRLKPWCITPLLFLTLLQPSVARADFWGGDVIVLTQILAQTIQQLTQLRSIFGTGQDTLGLLRDVNRGVKDGLNLIQIVHPGYGPGLYGNVAGADQLLRTVQDIYGQVPQSPEARLQASQDQSVAESLAVHGNVYHYADQVDEVSQQMLAHADVVNPQGAAKLQAQSLAVLIGVTTQLLRTNSAMLKLMAENMALSNRHEKIGAENFRLQYDGLGDAFSQLPTETRLPTLGGQ